MQGRAQGREAMGMSEKETMLIGVLKANSFNPNEMSKEKYTALKESIKKDGILQPLIVRPLLEMGEPVGFEVIDGEHRLKAAEELGLKGVPVVIENVPITWDAMRMCYKLNAERGTIDCFKEAVFFDLLAQTGLKDKDAAKEYSLSEQFIRDRKKLLSINEEQKELLLKKAPRELEITGAHWLAYAKASPESRIELCKTIGRQGSMSVRDFETEVKNAEHAVKCRKEFEAVLEKSEFKTCPTCKGKATSLSWQKQLQCEHFHDWDPKTGKTGQQIMGGSYNKVEKAKKPKFRRSLEIEIDWKGAFSQAQEFVLKNLGEIDSVSFTDKAKKEWTMSITRDKEFGHIGIKRGWDTEYQLNVRDPRSRSGKSCVCGPAAGEITKKDHENMLALVKQFKGKVIDKRVEKKEKKKAAKK